MLILSRLFPGGPARCVFGSVLVFSLAYAAPVTYTYTGNPFTTDTGTYTCPPECSFSGSFTVSSPLAGSLSYASITPTAFSFTDGNTTWNVADTIAAQDFFLISTNPAGAITNW